MIDDDDLDLPPPRRLFRCGGMANPYGPCGAPDCADCYPITAALGRDPFEDEEEDEDGTDAVAADDE